MIRTLLAAALIAAPAVAADDPVLADLAKAKATHGKEMAQLRQQLLDDIDKVIRQTNDMGGGIDYMLRERKGFAESGVTPILPKLKGASEKYLDAKASADAALEGAYATAIDASVKGGKLGDVAAFKAELKKMRDARQGVAEKPAPIIVRADEADVVREALSRARRVYEGEVKDFRKAVNDLFDTREDAIRKAGDKKALDDLKVQRKAFEELDEALTTLPIPVKNHLASARGTMDKAYQTAVKEYIRMKKDADAEKAEKDREAFLVASAFSAGKRTYVTTLKPLDVKAWNNAFKNDTAEYKLNGRAIPHSIFIHPDAGSTADVSYVLPPRATAFRTVVGVPYQNADLGNPADAIYFEVRVDGKLVWTSEPVMTLDVFQTCTLKLDKAKKLHLRVYCPKAHGGAHAVWFAPVLIE